jgi:hypothetical protein
VRFFLFGLVCLISLTCREVEPFSNPTAINGYQIDGRVTTENGIPIDSVEVRLYYYFDYVSNKPLDTITIVVTDSMKTVDISVVDRKYNLVRTLYLGLWRQGDTIPRFKWNGLDSKNQQVPSGLYYMQYTIDTLLIKSSPMIIDGHITAVTDKGGRFTISDFNLPIDSKFDAYNDDDTFYGVMSVLPEVALVLTKNGRYAEYSSIKLTKNNIKTLALTLK